MVSLLEKCNKIFDNLLLVLLSQFLSFLPSGSEVFHVLFSISHNGCDIQTLTHENVIAYFTKIAVALLLKVYL